MDDIEKVDPQFHTETIFYSPKYGARLWITEGLCINIVEGEEPHWLHRWLQKIILGFRWEKIH